MKSFKNCLESSIQEKIEQYKKYMFVWKRAKGDYERMIYDGEIPNEFKQYYPGWDIEDIKAIYRGVEGKDYDEEL